MRGYRYNTRNPYKNNLIVNGQDTSKWSASEIAEYNNTQDPVKKNMVLNTINSRIANENNGGVKYGSFEAFKQGNNNTDTKSPENWLNSKNKETIFNAASGVMNNVADGIISTNDYSNNIGLT